MAYEVAFKEYSESTQNAKLQLAKVIKDAMPPKKVAKKIVAVKKVVKKVVKKTAVKNAGRKVATKSAKTAKK
jgi:uncharacterized membrane protein